MTNENETIKDIATEFRELAKNSSDGIIAVKGEVIADRIDSAWKLEKSQSWHHREMEELILRHEKKVAELKKLIPKPDPDWKAICEKCHDGDIEPDCEYYGEPNGCNSPIYGEHPKAKPIGNAAAMRDALESILSILKGFDFDNKNAPTPDDLNCVSGAIGIANAALAKQPRNCDLFSIYSEAEDYWHENVECADVNGCFDVWLFEPAKQKGECDA